MKFTRHIALRLDYSQHNGGDNNHHEYTVGPFTQVGISALEAPKVRLLTRPT